MPITDPSEEYFKDGAWGWNGTKWVKLPLVFGYHDRWAEDLGGVKSGAGTYSADSTSVPAGEMWVLQQAAILNVTGARGTVRIELMGGVDYSSLAYASSLTAGAPLLAKGPIVLAEGDSVKVRMWSCLDADVIYASVWGYKMKVT